MTPDSRDAAARPWPATVSHPDLVAVYASRAGRLALLLRQTLVPLPEERDPWLRETRAATRAVVGGLRAAGWRHPCLVLQWRPLGQVARVLRRWRCVYEADPGRRAALTRVVEGRLADRRFLRRLTAAMGTRVEV